MKITTDWASYQRCHCLSPQTRVWIDYSRMGFNETELQKAKELMGEAFIKLEQLEKGAILNPDEGRMVGHYWLRAPELAPTAELSEEIRRTVDSIEQFAEEVHDGHLRGERGRSFINFLLVGIGGSSLGPKFLCDALCQKDDKMTGYFIDNTDPDGMDRIFDKLEGELDRTLVLIVSKSGSTVETANGMLETKAHYEAAGLNFSAHGVAITGKGSKLYHQAVTERWLGTFPMWDWVGGRTSVCSSVGLLPMALQGIKIREFLKGARDCDGDTRKKALGENAAAMMALAWRHFTKGQGGSQMVVLPYKDRLELLTKYLQQLIMESLGKEKDLDGNTVHQGIAVYGNKGSSDQHSYMQQLLGGPNNFFVTFLEVLKDREGSSPDVGGAYSGDYLQAFLYGSREALSQRGRPSMTITIPQVNPYYLGAIVALFERTVTFYAFFININAYHQPAVELGKKSAAQFIELKNEILRLLKNRRGESFTVEQLVGELHREGMEQMIYVLLRHLCANEENGIRGEGDNPFGLSYRG